MTPLRHLLFAALCGLALLLRPLPAAAQAAASAPAASAPTGAAADVRRPLLWQVRHGDQTLYLLGSFHLLTPEDAPLPAETERAFAAAQAVVFEIAPAEMDAPDAAARAQAYMGYADPGLHLSAVLPAATRERLQTLVAASGGSLQALEPLEPWAVNLGLVLGVTQQLGFRADLGLDRQLMARAAAAGKPTAGLETLDAQMQALDAAPLDEQVRALDEFVQDPRKAVQQVQDLHAWWRAGDVAALDAHMREDLQRKSPQTYRLLDVQRNLAWLPQLEARLQAPGSGTTLVVVGALHLLGPDGLVELLRAKGYAVERVCDACAAPGAP